MFSVFEIIIEKGATCACVPKSLTLVQMQVFHCGVLEWDKVVLLISWDFEPAFGLLF